MFCDLQGEIDLSNCDAAIPGMEDVLVFTLMARKVCAARASTSGASAMRLQ